MKYYYSYYHDFAAGSLGASFLLSRFYGTILDSWVGGCVTSVAWVNKLICLPFPHHFCVDVNNEEPRDTFKIVLLNSAGIHTVASSVICSAIIRAGMSTLHGVHMRR